MELKLKNTQEQVELIRAMGSKNKSTALEAQEAFAAFIGPVIKRVIEQTATTSLIYSDMEFDADSDPSIPFDLFYDQDEDYVTVWSQSAAGGLPSSHVAGGKELKISTYRLDSAVDWDRKYARRGRLDIASKAVNKMAQEILVKQERNGWFTILTALAQASTNSSNHFLTSDTQDQFVVNDLSRMMTKMRRINTSFASGTPNDKNAYRMTDLFVSPEILEDVRGFAYNDLNTLGSNGAVALPDSVRENIFRSAGTNEIFGVLITDLNELGDGEKYNVLFGSVAPNSIAHSSSNFDTGDDELLIGMDLSRDAFLRPVATQSESGGTILVQPDDQYAARSEKIGFYSFVEEGRICIDAKTIIGLIV